jgi:hypothetical protein
LNKLIALLGTIVLVLTSIVSADDKPSFKVNGDFRYRHEMIEKEDTKTRTRHRLRARVNVEGSVNDDAKIVVGISSGSDDPVSNNQSLDDGFSSKDVVLDIAFFEYKLKQIPGLSLQGGKVYNPFYKPGKSELIWDSDIRFEGMVAHYKQKYILTSLELIGAGFWIEEREDDKNSYLMALQGVFGHDVPTYDMTIYVGGAYYRYENAKGFASFFDEGDSYGNTIDTAGMYANDFEIIDITAELYFMADGIPVTIMSDYVTNIAADSLNDGWLAGVRFGKLKESGTWDCRYIYRELKRDAVVGIYTDSDFLGGGTDGKGHEFGIGVQLAPKVSFGATYFVNEIGFENSQEFNRLQVDAKFEF